MNLVNMAQRQDENLVLSDSVKIHKRIIDGAQYRGFCLSASETPSITLKHVFQWYPFCERTATTGWAVQALNKASQNSRLEVCLRNNAGDILVTENITTGPNMTPIFLPAQLSARASNENYHLTLRLLEGSKPKPAPEPKPKNNAVPSRSIFNRFAFKLRTAQPNFQEAEPALETAQPSRAFVAVHQVLHREEVLQLCQGRGIEIGPGHKPQVKPSNEVEVTYVEQSAPKDWERLYNSEGNYQVDPELWSRYQIGDACNLPVENDSLDFIFSSHVFEHLANPLGHLKYWITKLRDNGKVLGIVPDIAGCKDYVYRPSAMSELLTEQASGDMEPTLAHYQRWAKYRRTGQDPKEFYNAKRSIHVHYYTSRNMAEVLQYAVENLGYRWFDIRHTPNHKDFYFMLSK